MICSVDSFRVTIKKLKSATFNREIRYMQFSAMNAFYRFRVFWQGEQDKSLTNDDSVITPQCVVEFERFSAEDLSQRQLKESFHIPHIVDMHTVAESSLVPSRIDLFGVDVQRKYEMEMAM